MHQKQKEKLYQIIEAFFNVCSLHSEDWSLSTSDAQLYFVTILSR